MATTNGERSSSESETEASESTFSDRSSRPVTRNNSLEAIATPLLKTAKRAERLRSLTQSTSTLNAVKHEKHHGNHHHHHHHSRPQGQDTPSMQSPEQPPTFAESPNLSHERVPYTVSSPYIPTHAHVTMPYNPYADSSTFPRFGNTRAPGSAVGFAYPYNMNNMSPFMTNEICVFPPRRRAKKSDVDVDFLAHYQDFRILVIAGETENDAKQFGSIDKGLAHIKSLQKEKKPCWVDVQNITPEDLKLLEAEFDLHTLTAEDICEKDTREKTEVFDKYRAVIVHEAYFDAGSLEFSPFIMLVGNDCIFSVHSSATRNVTEVVKAIMESQLGMPQPDWVMYALMDVIVDSYIPLVNALCEEANSLDQLALSLSLDDQGDFLARIRIASSKLSRLRTTLLVKKEVLMQLMARAHTPFVTDITKIYLRDVSDEVDQLLQKLDIATVALTSFPSTFLARISVASGEASNQLSLLMKKFSVISMILLPLTLIAGLFGMNVKVPGQDEDNYYWFIGIVSFMAVSTVLGAIFFRRIHWL
eukprot:TRINITY_DN7291_c0_g1_i1.p1 TRINITY_DN7291_c0_g1~~TRINITY_DN7291_c0_g1_i1.p1  ORF type:complete len:532 (-),score=105.07 TRINITY_DN7291_c0_g1_i1:25-1620(-)